MQYILKQHWHNGNYVVSLISAFHWEAIWLLSVNQWGSDSHRSRSVSLPLCLSISSSLSLSLPPLFIPFLPVPSSIPLHTSLFCNFSFLPPFLFLIFLLCLSLPPSFHPFLILCPFFPPAMTTLTFLSCLFSPGPSKKAKGYMGSVDSNPSQLHFLILRPIHVPGTFGKSQRRPFL